jgi:hypothetical protein
MNRHEKVLYTAKAHTTGGARRHVAPAKLRNYTGQVVFVLWQGLSGPPRARFAPRFS